MKVLLLLFCLTTTTLLAQTPPTIDIEMVRKDFLSRPHITPDDFIKKQKSTMFKVMYANNLCFIHPQYKQKAGELNMRSSDLMVYRLTSGNWAFENILQTWYDIELVDAPRLIFLTEVQFCEPTGDCKTFKAISQYDGKELVVMRQYSGYDKTLYYDYLNKSGKMSDVKIAVGDTISRMITLSNFRYEQHQTSFTLNRKAEMISSISKTVIRKKVVVDSFERVIVSY
jgi:hypothetical protein